MEYKDIVALYFERSNQMQTLWTFYLGVCLVLPLLVGVMRSSSRLRFAATHRGNGFPAMITTSPCSVIGAIVSLVKP